MRCCESLSWNSVSPKPALECGDPQTRPLSLARGWQKQQTAQISRSTRKIRVDAAEFGKDELPQSRYAGLGMQATLNAWEGRAELSSPPRTSRTFGSKALLERTGPYSCRFLKARRRRLAQRPKAYIKTIIAEVSGASGLLELGRMLHAHHKRRSVSAPRREKLLKMLVMAQQGAPPSLGDDLYAAITEMDKWSWARSCQP